MLTRLLVQNFQCHSRLRVDLDPKITTIVGPTDSGKSALIRALRWICQNQPRGDGFIKDGEQGTTVQLLVDGKWVVRKLGKGDNLYQLDEAEFRAFGTDVPAEIQNLLNIGQANFQGQHDSVFWFSETAGEVSRQLNAVVDLSIIDKALGNAVSKVKECRDRVKFSLERLKESKAKKDELEWVVEANEDFQVVEEVFERKAAKQSAIEGLQNRVNYTRAAEQSFEQANTQAQELRSLGLVAASVMKVKDRIKGLQSRIDSIRKNDQVVMEFKEFDVAQLDECVDRWKEKRKLSTRLSTLIERLRGAEDSMVRLVRASEIAQSELEEQLGGRCPVCGSEMKNG